MKPYAFGVDLGGNAIKIGLFQTTGNLVEKWTIPTRLEDHGSHLLSDVVDAIRAKMEERSLTWDVVEGVGMGVPGPVDQDGTVMRCVNLGWDILNVPKAVQELEPAIEKLKVANDVNAATLGEMWQGGAQWNNSAVMVTLGVGVGSGIVVDNKVFVGSTGAAGEIGHMCVNPKETERCTCGNYGCLEQYCSDTGLVHIAKMVLEELPEAPSMLREGEITPETICQAAKKGDIAASEVMERFGQLMGQALTAVACTVNPQVFVIGGQMAQAGMVILKPIEAYFRRYAFHAFRNTPFVLAELGEDAGIYGSVRMLFDEVKLEEEPELEEEEELDL